MKETEQRSRGAQGRQHKKEKEKKKTLFLITFSIDSHAAFFPADVLCFFFFFLFLVRLQSRDVSGLCSCMTKKTVFDVTKLWDCHGRMNVNSRESCKK